MSRDDGFDVADVATGLYDDPKVKALWHELCDQGRMGHALTLYMATVLASWRHGCRVTLDTAAPVWMEPDSSLVAALQAVKLLDKTRKVPIRAWNGWFGVAESRREKLRAKWRRDNERRLSVRGVTAAVPPHPDRKVRPSVPSVRTVESRGRRAGDTVQGTNGREGATHSLADAYVEVLAAAGLPK